MPKQARAKSDSEIYHIQLTQEQKEELAGGLLNVKAITFREIAELCNLSVYKVAEIEKLKNAQVSNEKNRPQKRKQLRMTWIQQRL